MLHLVRRFKKALKNSPNLVKGYNIYADSDKFRLIRRAFTDVVPHAESFADLGGVWKVDAAYTIETMKRFRPKRGYLIDTDIAGPLYQRLREIPNLTTMREDFTKEDVISSLGTLDAVFLFDVLLHQANPSWKEVLRRYSSVASCMIIYNQQFTRGAATVRLTDLPYDEYVSLVPVRNTGIYRYVYDHATEIHPEYNKPWKDIHNIFQWGITDADLRATMENLGYKQVFFKNYGQFSNLEFFENHGFIFVKT